MSDRGTNLLSFLMKDICKMLGIEKLNTTASHPQCNSVVERFNRTLKLMLRKHVAKYGMQWDQYISGVVWAYCNTPHSSTGESHHFYSLGLIVVLQQRQLSYWLEPSHLELLMCVIIKNKWYYHQLLEA